jgi:hypothetical protein
MKRLYNYLNLILGCVILIACGGGDGGGGGDDGPQVSKDYLSITPNVQLLGDGESKEISISANCSWTITKDADWITINPMSGNGNQTITISAGKNTTNAERFAVLSVKGGSLPERKVTVTQLMASAENPVLSADVSSLNYEKKGGNKNFSITSNINWTITCPEWCSLSMTSGKGSATVTVSVGENPKAEQRSGQMIISGEGVDDISISVIQDANDKDSDEPGGDDNQPPSY